MNIYKLKKEKLAILLRDLEDYSSLVWIGSNKKQEDTNQEPLILNIGDKEIFFYSKGIKKVKSEWLKNPLIDYENNNEIYQLSLDEQKELITTFGKFIDSKDSFRKFTFFQLENDFLKKEAEGLTKVNDLFFRTNQKLTKELIKFNNENQTLKNIKDLLEWDNIRMAKELKVNKDVKEVNELMKENIESVSKDLEEIHDQVEKLNIESEKSFENSESFIKNQEKVNQNIKSLAKENLYQKLSKEIEEASEEFLKKSEEFLQQKQLELEEKEYE